MRVSTICRAVFLWVAALAAVHAVGVTRRHHHDHYDDVPPPPMPFDEAPRFADADPTTVGEGNRDVTGGMTGSNADLVKSVYDLLAKKRDTNVHELSKIMQKKVETAKEQDSLRERTEELKERAAMLTRLQFCLEADAKTKAAQLAGADANLANKTSPLTSAEALQNKEAELEKLRLSLNKLKTELEERERELAEREKRLKERIAAVRKAEEEIEARANDPNYKGSPDYKKRASASLNETTAAQLAAGQRFCPGDCGQFVGCASCVANPHCGWCTSSQSCMAVVGDSKTPAGNCTLEDFSHLFCKAEACTQHKTCKSCLSDPECGMCANSGQCLKGAVTGPEAGQCATWNFANPMRFFSLNIYGKDTINTTARANAIFAMIEEANADFVTLQEVEDWFLEALSQQKWAKTYSASDFGSGHAPGGLLILSKMPLAQVSYYERTNPGQVEVDQRARMLIVRPQIGSHDFVVATTTLDWRSSENRAESLDYMFGVLNTTSDVVLTGDFNFDFGSQPESSKIPSKYKDVWLSLRPDAPGFTWDPLHNAYARASDARSRPSRIDRMFVSSEYATFRKITKVGSLDVSPHYGLLADMQLFGIFC